MVRENRTWVHPNAIRRGEPRESGSYLHYFRHWQHFTLKMDDYRFIRWVASHNTNQNHEDPAADAAAKKLAEHGWESLDKDERETFANHQIKEIGAEALQEGFSLEGWARLEGGIGREQITAFAVTNDPGWKPQDFDDEYEKTFRKLRVSVRSSLEEHPGSIWVWGESMREIAREDDMMDDEDALYVQFYMLPEKLKALARDLSAQPVRPTLILEAEGLLFRDEVESALSELWHPSEYVMIFDHRHTAILNTIRFDLQTGLPETQRLDDVKVDYEDSLGAARDRSVQHLASVHLSQDAVTKGLRSLKHAIWLLAAVIMLTALFR